jgi:hypothetical protein
MFIGGASGMFPDTIGSTKSLFYAMAKHSKMFRDDFKIKSINEYKYHTSRSGCQIPFRYAPGLDITTESNVQQQNSME